MLYIVSAFPVQSVEKKKSCEQGKQRVAMPAVSNVPRTKYTAQHTPAFVFAASNSQFLAHGWSEGDGNETLGPANGLIVPRRLVAPRGHRPTRLDGGPAQTPEFYGQQVFLDCRELPPHVGVAAPAV